MFVVRGRVLVVIVADVCWSLSVLLLLCLLCVAVCCLLLLVVCCLLAVLFLVCWLLRDSLCVDCCVVLIDGCLKCVDVVCCLPLLTVG